MTWSVNQEYIYFSLTKFESSALDLEDFSPLFSERASCLAKDSKPVNNKTCLKTQVPSLQVKSEVLAFLRKGQE